MNPAAVSAVAVVVTAILTFLGTRYAAHQSARSAVETKAIDATVADRRVDLEERRTDGEQFDRLWKRMDKMQREIDDLRRLNAAQDRMIRAHQPWDATAVEELRKARVHIIDPPPLTA